MSKKGEFLGKGAIVSIGVGKFTGKQRQAAFLTEYDEDDDSYVGVIFPHNEKFTQFFHSLGKGAFEAETPINVGVVERYTGLRHYPYVARPDYAFQFVTEYEDAELLTNIATANYEATKQEVVTEVVETPEENISRPTNTQPNLEIATWKVLGYSSKDAWIAAGKPGKK